MPELLEKRQFPRSPVKLPVLFRREEPAPVKAGAGWTHNLSEEGACLELPERLEPPSALRLVFQTDAGALELDAAVIWAAVLRPKGDGILHGVAFRDLAPADRQAIRSLLGPSG